jgi:hypothetical protein
MGKKYYRPFRAVTAQSKVRQIAKAGSRKQIARSRAKERRKEQQMPIEIQVGQNQWD